MGKMFPQKVGGEMGEGEGGGGGGGGVTGSWLACPLKGVPQQHRQSTAEKWQWHLLSIQQQQQQGQWAECQVQ